MKKKRKKKPIKVIVISFIILLFASILLFIASAFVCAFKDLKQEDILKQEITNFISQDLATGNFEVEIKTKGDYAYIERAVKNHFKNLSENVKSVNDYNDKLSSYLEPEKLQMDRPNYKAAHNMVNNTKIKIKKTMDNIKDLCKEEKIKNLLDKNKIDDYKYYYDFYIQLIYTKEDQEMFQNTAKKVEKTSKYMNEYLEKIDQLLYYLEEIDKQIQYTKEHVYFETEEALQKYKNFLIELDNITEKINSKNNIEEAKIDSV